MLTHKRSNLKPHVLLRLVAISALSIILCVSSAVAESGTEGSAGEGASVATSVTAVPVTGTGQAVSAAVGEATNGRVTNIFADEDIRQALRDIAAQAGVVIIPDQSVHGVVSCELRDVPLEEALSYVLYSGGFVYKNVNGVYFVGSADPGSPSFAHLADTRRVSLRNAQAPEVYQALSPAYQVYVQCDAANNVLVVSAPEPILSTVIGHIELIDQPLEQVMIEIMVAEINRTAAKQLGVEWRWDSFGFNVGDPMNGDATNGNSSGMGPLGERNTLSWTEATVQDLVNLKLLIENNNANVRANPRVTTLNAHEAELFVGREQYFALLRGTTFYATQNLEKVKAGITLRIKPFVGEGGNLTIQIDPEVSDVIAVDGNGAPIVATRRVHTIIRCQEGQTVVLGGLTQVIEKLRVSKVPILGDLPLIGALFREKDRSNQETELVILLRPHILDNGILDPSQFKYEWPEVVLPSERLQEAEDQATSDSTTDDESTSSGVEEPFGLRERR
jgi:type II secretory pathway component GspD/PulD (secretin)